MLHSIRFIVIIYCMIINYGVLSIAWAQPGPTPKALAEARANKLAYTGYSLEQLKTIEPTSPNPHLSLLPAGMVPDLPYWKARMRAEAIARRAAQTRGTGGEPTIEESEPNDSPEVGNPISDFGNGPGQTSALNVTGDFPEPPAATPSNPFPEDDGAIPLASDVSLSAGQRVKVTTLLGDGPHGSVGSGSGDFDFYAISGVTAGQILTADIDTDPESLLFLDSFLVIWDSAGNLLAFNDDDASGIGPSVDSFLYFVAPADGTYYISVGSFGSEIPQDPFDSSSGLGFFFEGFYDLTLGLDAYDTDYFTVALNTGDVLNVNGLGAISQVSLFDPAGVERITSSFDLTPFLAEGAPFSAGDNPSLVYVIDQPGTYSVRVTGSRGGVYLTELRTARPPLESAEPGTKQILFIDFDGEVIDTAIFGGFGRRLLSPLRAFLGNWELQPSDEDAVIDAMLQVVEENLQTDILANGNNPQFAIEIRNSRDHDDPFGEPNVSRIIVGGTIAESEIPTIGIAQSIDVGNFNTTETGLVLLDLLSAPSEDPNSINTFPIDASANIIKFIGTAVGNIVAHEAGHFFGNAHTDQFNASANLMDQGGNPANTFGVGADNTFGTEDDIDVDFGLDRYVPNEGLLGLEDTLHVIAFGLSSMPNDLSTTHASVPTASRQTK